MRVESSGHVDLRLLRDDKNEMELGGMNASARRSVNFLRATSPMRHGGLSCLASLMVKIIALADRQRERQTALCARAVMTVP